MAPPAEKNLLLISYVFPPYPGIGGRRWAKFAKYLSLSGCRIHVICAANPFEQQSSWSQDVRRERIEVYPLRPLFPRVLLEKPQTLLQKALYRGSLLLLKALCKGTPYERAAFWRTTMTARAERIIAENDIDTVIVSCAPFHTAAYAVEMKKRSRNLRVAVDFRDPWTWGEGYGFKDLSDRRRQYEKAMELSVVTGADVIFAPVQPMIDQLCALYPQARRKFRHLPHAYDPDDIPAPAHSAPCRGASMVCVGTLYEGIDAELRELATALTRSARLRLDFYVHAGPYAGIFRTFNLLDRQVTYHEAVSSRELFARLSGYDYALVVFPDRFRDYLTAKFYELVYARKPILFIGSSGLVSDFITKNRIGMHIEPNNIVGALLKLAEAGLPGGYAADFDATAYGFGEVTKTLLKELHGQ